MGATADFGGAGSIEVKAAYRDRRNPFVIGFTPLLSVENQQSKVTSRPWDFNARYDKHFEARGYSHMVSAGVDLQGAKYKRQQDGETLVGTSHRQLGDVDSKAVYAETILRAPAGFAFNAGVRFNRFETHNQEQRYTGECQTTFVDIDPGPGVNLFPVLSCVKWLPSPAQHRRDVEQSCLRIGAHLGSDQVTHRFCQCEQPLS